MHSISSTAGQQNTVKVYSNCYIHNHGVYIFTYIHEYWNTVIYVIYINIRMKVFNKQKCRLSYIQLKMLLFTHCVTSLIFCACAAAMLLPDYFHHHAKIWPIRIMDHEQNGCFGGIKQSVPPWPWPQLEPVTFWYNMWLNDVNMLGVTIFFSRAAWFIVGQWSQEMSLTSPRTIRIHVHDCMGLTNSRLAYIGKRDINWMNCDNVQYCLTPMLGNGILICWMNCDNAQYWCVR